MRKKSFHYLVALFIVTITVSCISSPQGNRKAKKDPGVYDWCGNPKYNSPYSSKVISKNLKNQMPGLNNDWYQNASFYHIWVKAFCDSNGDGCGDLNGITQKLSYIKNNIGCDAIWLSPIFDCDGKGIKPQENMHGYDIVNYYAVNPYFGTMKDVETLLSKAHQLGIKVIFDFVPNHTSSKNPWFTDSAMHKNGKSNWYLWNDAPLPWAPMGNKYTWSRNRTRYNEQDPKPYYYGAFWSGMPDLNFRNYEVREEMKNVARFWLNKGFDGIRIDAVRYLIETPDSVIDTEESHQYFAELREVLDEYSTLGYPKFMVCEAWITNDRDRMNAYFGSEKAPEFHMVFDFDAGKSIYAALNLGSDLAFTKNLKDAADNGQYGVFLNNHDEYQKRPATEFEDVRLQKLATAALLLRPQVPFIYFGNEYGQRNHEVKGDMQYRYAPDWSKIEQQIKDNDSLLAFHKKLLTIRQQHPALRTGTLSFLSCLPKNKAVTAYILEEDNDKILCLFNFSKDNYETVMLTGEKLPKETSFTSILGNSDSRAEVTNDEIIIKNIAAYEAQLFSITKM